MEGANNLFKAFLLITTIAFSYLCTTASSARTLAGTTTTTTTTNTQYIRTSCSATAYPRLCYASLYSQATAIRSDPKLLATAAMAVTLNTAKSTSAAMVTMAHGGGMTAREVGAMRDCVDELSDSVDELRRSMVEMGQLGGRDFEMKMSDIQTWVSAALTDEDTCMEGFAGNAMNGKTKAAVRTHVLNVVHMTSNALALINSYATVING